MIWAVLFGSGMAMAMTGAVLGAALGLTGLLILHFQAGGATSLAAQTVYHIFSSFTLSAVPMFVLLGELIVQSGLSRRIYGSIAPLFARIPGGLLHTNVAVCTLFGAVSGSSTATAAAVGSVAYPELAERGYRRDLVAGSLAGAGTLGLLIPPSLSLIVYGAWKDVSVGKLFLAGIVPGLLCSLLFMGYILVRSMMRRDYTGAPKAVDEAPFSRLPEIWPLLILIVAVLGSIYGGVATVTEAAGFGCLAALVLGVFAGDLDAKGIWHAMRNSVVAFGAIKLVIMGAVILGQAISILGLPRHLLAGITDMQLSPHVVVLCIIVLYVLLGCVLDGISLMLLTLPFVFPLMTGLGFDPVWLGVFITLMIEIGMITPPIGVNLFVLNAISRGELRLGQIAMATLPYWMLLLTAVGLILVFPMIVLWLPSLK